MRLISTIMSRGPLWVSVNLFFSFVDNFIEYILYPAVIGVYGLVIGTGLMMLLSFFLCWGLIVGYDRLASTWWRDMFGFETLKKEGLRFRARVRVAMGSHAYQKARKSWQYKIAHRIGWLVTFLGINIWFDPMTYVILTRPVNRIGMGKREWLLFIASTVVSCTLWGLLVLMGIESLQLLAPAFVNYFMEVAGHLLPGT